MTGFRFSKTRPNLLKIRYDVAELAGIPNTDVTNDKVQEKLKFIPPF